MSREEGNADEPFSVLKGSCNIEVQISESFLVRVWLIARFVPQFMDVRCQMSDWAV
jgi:hypothetical protein